MSESPPLALQPPSPELSAKIANTIRFLAADGVQKAAGGAKGRNELAGNGLVGGEHEAAPDDDKPHDAEIAEDEGADGTRGHIDQYHGADDAADGPGNRQDDENAAVDIAMQDV